MESEGLEVLHASDLPGRSGTGSSSTFVVGLLNALYGLQGKRKGPDEIATEAIHIEQKVLGETVGCQDQTFASFGGLNVIYFRKNGEIDVRPLSLEQGHVEELQDSLLLFFTKISRTSSEVASTYVPSIHEREAEQFAMMRLAEKAIDCVYRKDWEKLGWCVDQSWRIKSGLSSAVSNSTIDKIYATARLNGAWGGKITGAGGGGCMILVVPQEKRQGIIEAVTAAGCVHIPFRFCFEGSAVIFSDRGR